MARPPVNLCVQNSNGGGRKVKQVVVGVSLLGQKTLAHSLQLEDAIGTQGLETVLAYLLRAAIHQGQSCSTRAGAA